MPENADSKVTPLDFAMERFLQENPHVREALDVFAITVSQYERLLANLNPPRTITSNVTTEAQLGH